MKLTFLGTGTSHGVPVIGCNCAVCKSSDPKDTRFRCSVFIEETDSKKSEDNSENAPQKILIDAGPEFRLQALRAKINHIDAVLFTHSHADHLHGIDDLRIFSFKRWHGAGCSEKNAKYPMTKGKGLPVYANEETVDAIKYRFDYIFKSAKKGGGVAKLDVKDVGRYSSKRPLKIGSLSIIPIPLIHGATKPFGYLFVEDADDSEKQQISIAYLTDCNDITNSAIKTLKENCGNLEHLVIDGLRDRPHQTHFSFGEALDIAAILKPRHTWITHINHDMSHDAIQKWIDDYVSKDEKLSELAESGATFEPAYDELAINT